MKIPANLHTAYQKILNLVYPPKCIYCNHLLPRDLFEAGVCTDCAARLPRMSTVDVRWVAGSQCLSPFWYRDAVRESIHRYKFQGRAFYHKVYGRELRACLLEAGIARPDLVTYAPLSKKRLRQRGYDQARLLAEEAACLYGQKAVPLLRKVRDTKAQSSLDAFQRQENVMGAYACIDKGRLDGKRILLVDDVVTTGATLAACVELLLQAGGKEVICLTLARSLAKPQTEDQKGQGKTV